MTLLLALALVTSVMSTDIILEAEDTEIGREHVETTREGFSGTGYVSGVDSLGFAFEAPRGAYELHIRYVPLGGGMFPPYTAWVNGRRITGNVTRSTEFVERRLAEVWLQEGENTISIRANFDFDYIRLVPIEYPRPETPNTPLSDPHASPATQSLYAFLLDQYGQRILSGQQELREVNYIRGVTGREPAILGGDLIEYSPSRWERGARPRLSGYASVEDIIEWAGEDGIVTMMWHWNAPTDLIDSGDQLWWRGFYTEATTFDFAAALADPDSERYQLLLRDIDAIAVQLQKFQDADVPVLWRPLHEAEGGWFWWGARGPEPFKELWRLLYDRLVNEHQIHNLIWVFTHEHTLAWYPGDDYVDIVGRDVYVDDRHNLMRSHWNQLQEFYGDRMLVSLAESGTLPHPEALADFGVWWSWFAIWSGSFIRNVDQAYLTDVYHSDVVMTRADLPDWRSYSGVSTEPGIPAAEATLALYPNPTSGPARLRITLPAAAEVRVEVYDLMGRQVRSESLGYRPSETLETGIDLSDLAAGSYIVRVVSDGFVENRRLTVIR